MNLAGKVSILLGGALFGFGLAWSGMIKPEVVLSFLTFDDFGLLLVLGSAVMVTFAVYTLVPKIMKKPLFDSKFSEHATVNSRDTVLGAVLFGTGWGLSGVCPGPAIAGLGAGNWPLLVCVAAMFAGAWLQGWLASKQ